jgi:RNA polymerase sigma factor (sigma-70 family)
VGGAEGASDRRERALAARPGDAAVLLPLGPGTAGRTPSRVKVGAGSADQGVSERSQLRLLRGGREPAGTAVDLARLTDEELLALVSRSDEDALAELYDRYARAAYGLSLRILRDRALAEDAVQEAFLQVWRAARTFAAERAKPSTWILTLVHRRAVDLVRREQRRRAPPPGGLEEESDGAVEDEAALRSRRQLVQEALRRLPVEQRETLELAYYGGFTQTELAERLGVPLGTVKSRMFAGLRKLRDLLAESGLDAADL